ncbi:MAG: VWA domain-containing protein [Gammaproteobacteria bacterium]|nr:VWA domain-containing protein [Gammaproteobacteria bacterium]
MTATMTACTGGQITDSDSDRAAAPPPTLPAEPAPMVETENESARVAGERSRLVKMQAEQRVGTQADATGMALYAPALSLVASEPLDRETYAHVESNPVKLAAEEPVSTFSIDVDTGSYSNVRRFLSGGALPPQDAVRVEEMINYFDYDYPVPDSRRQPFSVRTELASAPWNPDTVLMQVGIKGYQVAPEDRAPANLVFLLDVSGSMSSADKLPLLKKAFRLLTAQLDERDRVSIAVYAGSSGVVLEPTRGSDTATIMAALDRLSAGGSTNGAAGIRLAYDLAQDALIDGGINRVILATDGDFNVGTVNFEALVDLVERERKSGVSLTTLGFGTGNYNDRLMERLADAGNGNHAYIDTLAEARKVLVEQVSSTLQTIASDVKIQIEFNPAVVAEYRLIGYENRMLAREDFNNDQVDAGEIGAGHTVTAMYELALVGGEGRKIDPLRYGSDRTAGSKHGELAFVKLRYKAPEGGASKLLQYPVRPGQIHDIDATSDAFRFAAAVAAFGQKLAGYEYLGTFGYSDIGALAEASRGDDAAGYRNEFLGLVARADDIESRDGPVKISGGPQ